MSGARLERFVPSAVAVGGDVVHREGARERQALDDGHRQSQVLVGGPRLDAHFADGGQPAVHQNPGLVAIPLEHADRSVIIGVVMLSEEGELGVVNQAGDDGRKVVVILGDRIGGLQLQELLADSRGDREVHGLD